MQDGKSNYLEGAMLLGLYVIIALAFVRRVGPNFTSYCTIANGHSTFIPTMLIRKGLAFFPRYPTRVYKG